jgi:DNA-binding LytR/AlgR family response regulator
VAEAVRWFKSNKQPDLVFLDIQLADELSFKIVEQVKIHAPIIFTTAYDQYALKAFKVNSIDYLLKPVDLDDLRKAFEKLQLLTSPAADQAISADQIAAVWKMLNQPFKSRFIVKIGAYLRGVPVEEIQCFYSRYKMTYLVNSEGRSYPTEYSLTDIEGLVDPSQFFRVSRQYIVRADAIKEVVTYSKSRLKVILDPSEIEDIIVSRERVADFKEWLDQ